MIVNINPPLSGFKSPIKIFTKVVFPTPLSPLIIHISPLIIFKFKLFKIKFYHHMKNKLPSIQLY